MAPKGRVQVPWLRSLNAHCVHILSRHLNLRKRCSNASCLYTSSANTCNPEAGPEDLHGAPQFSWRRRILQNQMFNALFFKPRSPKKRICANFGLDPRCGCFLCEIFPWDPQRLPGKVRKNLEFHVAKFSLSISRESRIPGNHCLGISLFFPECVARVPVSLWGSMGVEGCWGCVRSTSRLRPQPFATVHGRWREPRMAVPILRVLQQQSLLQVSNAT